MMARTPGSVQGIGFLLVLPLSFGSNTFVATETMPGWLQAFVNVNPISHLVSTVRALMNGGAVRPRPGLDPRLDGCAAGRLRPAGPERLPQAGLIGLRLDCGRWLADNSLGSSRAIASARGSDARRVVAGGPVAQPRTDPVGRAGRPRGRRGRRRRGPGRRRRGSAAASSAGRAPGRGPRRTRPTRGQDRHVVAGRARPVGSVRSRGRLVQVAGLGRHRAGDAEGDRGQVARGHGAGGPASVEPGPQPSRPGSGGGLRSPVSQSSVTSAASAKIRLSRTAGARHRPGDRRRAGARAAAKSPSRA